MNQILNVEDDNKPKKEKIKNNTPIEIHSIVKFFSIIILIFGICMIGTGSYSMYQESIKESKVSKPEIYMEQIAETQVLVRVTHSEELDTIWYSWNDEEQISIDCKGKKQAESRITIPSGTNTLKVYAKDIKEQEIEYSKVYMVESSININLEPEGSNLKITANGVDELQYMTYRWDEDDEIRVDIEGNEIEEIIEIPRGLHKLTIVAVDINNKTEVKEQDINGVTKPKLEVLIAEDSSSFTMKTSDEEGIKQIEFNINGQEYLIDLEAELSPEERKEFEYTFQLEEGENNLEVTVYNNSDITETFKKVINR